MATETATRPVIRRLPPAERSWEGALVVTFSFKCNIACTFCMVEDVLGEYQGVSLERFERLVAERAEVLTSLRSVYFGGGEVTLSRDLPRYVELAKSLPNAPTVRVQTNAIRLDDPEYLDTLVRAGVDELFISIHGHDEATCEAITQRRGSFRRIVAGIEAAGKSKARLITNTVMVKDNHAHLADIVRLVAPFGPASMEFWNYWPRVHEQDPGRFVVPVGTLKPHVHAAARECLAAGFPPVIKWFPRCLMGEYVDYHDDGQPKMLIEERFWDREPSYTCLYEGVCSAGRSTCSGLSDTYVALNGYEQDLLVPDRTEAGSRRVEDALFRSLLKDAVPRRAEMAIVAAFLAELGLAFDASIEGFRLASFARSRDRREAQVVLTRGERRIELRLRMRDETRRAHARTPSFDLMLASADPEVRADAPKVLAALSRRIESHDRGGLVLPR